MKLSKLKRAENFEKEFYFKMKIFLCYRMGSFSSTPKILNDDNQDSDVNIPNGMSRQELLQYCQKQQQTQMFKRSFRRARESQESLTYGFKVRKLNTVSKGIIKLNSIL